MEALHAMFNTLNEAFGPVGALFVIISAHLFKRLMDIQAAQMTAAVADAKLQTDLMHAFNDMKASFDQLAMIMRSVR